MLLKCDGDCVKLCLCEFGKKCVMGFMSGVVLSGEV